MGQIEKYVSGDIIDKSDIDPPLGSIQTMQYRNHIVMIETRRMIDLAPRVRLDWTVQASVEWNRNSKLLVFRNDQGFFDYDKPNDLYKHGRLIVEVTGGDESNRRGWIEEHLPAGQHFYTLIVHTKWFANIFHSIAGPPLHFSVQIPNAQAMLGNMKMVYEAQREKRTAEQEGLEHEALVNELTIRKELSKKKLEAFRNPPPSPPQLSGPERRKKETKENILDWLVDEANKLKLQKELEQTTEYQSVPEKVKRRVAKKINEAIDKDRNEKGWPV